MCKWIRIPEDESSPVLDPYERYWNCRCCERSLKPWVAEILLAPEGLCSVKLVHMYLLEKPALINKLQESRYLDFNLLLKLIKLAAELFLSPFSCTPVGADVIFTSSVTNTNGNVHSSGVSNFLMRFMRISTSLRPIIAETNQFLRFLGLIHLPLNEINSSNSECTAWVSIPCPTRLRYAARGHVFQLHLYYKNCTVTQQATGTRGQQLSPQRRLCPLIKKKKNLDTHDTGRQTCLLLPMLTPKRWTGLHQRRQEHVTMSLVHCVIWSDKFQLTHTRTRLTPAYSSIRPSSKFSYVYSLKLHNILFHFFSAASITSGPGPPHSRGF